MEWAIVKFSRTEQWYKTKFFMKGFRYRAACRQAFLKFRREEKLWQRRNKARHIPLYILIPSKREAAGFNRYRYTKRNLYE